MKHKHLYLKMINRLDSRLRKTPWWRFKKILVLRKLINEYELKFELLYKS